jgi:hypothetical protein
MCIRMSSIDWYLNWPHWTFIPWDMAHLLLLYVMLIRSKVSSFCSTLKNTMLTLKNKGSTLTFWDVDLNFYLTDQRSEVIYFQSFNFESRSKFFHFKQKTTLKSAKQGLAFTYKQKNTNQNPHAKLNEQKNRQISFKWTMNYLILQIYIHMSACLFFIFHCSIKWTNKQIAIFIQL